MTERRSGADRRQRHSLAIIPAGLQCAVLIGSRDIVLRWMTPIATTIRTIQHSKRKASSG